MQMAGALFIFIMPFNGEGVKLYEQNFRQWYALCG